MKLICILCERAIEVGVPLLANQSGELAHQSCVESKSEVVVQPPSVTILSPKIEKAIEPCPPPSPPSTSSPRPFLGISSLLQKVCPVCVTACNGKCVVCGKPCIGHCPVCLRLVCQDFGYAGPGCSGQHEAVCPGAEQQRVKERTSEVSYQILTTLPPEPKNGKHKTCKRPNGRSRR